MTIVLKIVQLLIDLASWTKLRSFRINLRKEFENEGAIVKSKKLARAYEAFRNVVLDRSDPDKLHQDDGHRRD